MCEPTDADRLRAYVHQITDEEVVEILASMRARDVRFGRTTSVWHEWYLWERTHDSRPRCTICGSRGRLAAHGAHERCRLLAERGLPTPPMPEHMGCPCHRCRQEVR